MRLRIAIPLGDVTGIGPEVALKALATETPGDDSSYVLVGDAAHVLALNDRLGLGLPLTPERVGSSSNRFFISQPAAEPLPSGLIAGAAAAARAAVDALRSGAMLCLRKEADALVTAPVNKEAIIRAGVPFVGQTELLASLAQTEKFAMMLLGQDDRGRWLRVALATTHLPLKNVAEHLTQEKLRSVIQLTADACGALGLSRARVAVCGLNPHAGEGGNMGIEEQTIIGPAVEAARQDGIDVVGPLSADTLFYNAYRSDYDAVVAMYHDQGLAPLKMVAFENGVNWTLGLPFIRTSPDHGTAYDIAGQGKANPSSMMAALRLAKQLARARRPGASGSPTP